MPTALITGTSTGIGQACVARLAGKGWTVFATVRRDEDAQRLKESSAGDVRPLLLDVADRDRMRAVVDDLAREVEGLDGLVNNAGVGDGGPTEYVDEAVWRRVFDVNFFAPVALTQATMPLLRAARGRVVYIGSIGGRVAAPGLAPYSASKFALEAVAESQRHEFGRADNGVQVAIVEPGEVRTAIWDKADTTVDDLQRALAAAGATEYQWLVDQSRGFAAEGRSRGVDADRVARAVEHALTAKRPRARYLVGPDAQISGNVITRLPDRLRDTLVGAQGRLWERKGRSAPR